MQSGRAPSRNLPQNHLPWRSAFESAAVGMAIADPTGRFVATYKAYQDIVGFSGEAALDISEKTVESHRTNIRRKLRIRSVGQLVRYAVRNGIVQAGSENARRR